MAVLTVIKDIEGSDFVIGVVCETFDGKFWFNPKLSSHKPGRKKHDKSHDAIPKWAWNMADRIVEEEE